MLYNFCLLRSIFIPCIMHFFDDKRSLFDSFESLCSIPLYKYTTICYVIEYYTAVKVKSFIMLTDVWIAKLLFNSFIEI